MRLMVRVVLLCLFQPLKRYLYPLPTRLVLFVYAIPNCIEHGIIHHHKIVVNNLLYEASL